MLITTDHVIRLASGRVVVVVVVVVVVIVVVVVVVVVVDVVVVLSLFAVIIIITKGTKANDNYNILVLSVPQNFSGFPPPPPPPPPPQITRFKVMGTIASQLKALSQNTPQSSIIL